MELLDHNSPCDCVELWEPHDDLYEESAIEENQLV